MKCIMCGGNLILQKPRLYHYKMSGLSNIYLEGIKTYHCSNKSCGEVETSFPNLVQLLQLIAHHIACQKNCLLPEEIRFLRTHLGFSGIKFANIMGVTPETVTRWEKGSIKMKSTCEKLLRVLILSKLGPFRDYEELEEFSSVSSKTSPKRYFKIQDSKWVEDSAA